MKEQSARMINENARLNKTKPNPHKWYFSTNRDLRIS